MATPSNEVVSPSLAAAFRLSRETPGYQRWVRALAGNAKAVVGACILFLVVVGAIGAPLLAPVDPNTQVLADQGQIERAHDGDPAPAPVSAAGPATRPADAAVNGAVNGAVDGRLAGWGAAVAPATVPAPAVTGTWPDGSAATAPVLSATAPTMPLAAACIGEGSRNRGSRSRVSRATTSAVTVQTSHAHTSQARQAAPSTTAGTVTVGCSSHPCTWAARGQCRGNGRPTTTTSAAGSPTSNTVRTISDHTARASTRSHLTTPVPTNPSPISMPA